MDRKTRILVAELVGTLVLILGGSGTAVLATGKRFSAGSVGVLGVALAFGLSLVDVWDTVLEASGQAATEPSTPG